MARSLKKGPYVFQRLLKKVEEMEKTGKKTVTKQKKRINIKIGNIKLKIRDNGSRNISFLFLFASIPTFDIYLFLLCN